MVITRMHEISSPLFVTTNLETGVRVSLRHRFFCQYTGFQVGCQKATRFRDYHLNFPPKCAHVTTRGEPLCYPNLIRGRLSFTGVVSITLNFTPYRKECTNEGKTLKSRSPGGHCDSIQWY